MKLNVGDVIECRVNESYRYAQLLHIHPMYHEIIGLDSRCFDEEVTDRTALDFSTTLIFPLSRHLQSGDLKGSIRTELRSAHRAPMPRFKLAIRDETGEATYWWIWDGDGIEVANPADDLDALPVRCTSSLAEVLGVWSVEGGY